MRNLSLIDDGEAAARFQRFDEYVFVGINESVALAQQLVKKTLARLFDDFR